MAASDRRTRPIDWVAAAIPVLLVAALLAIYAISPWFYLRYVLEYQQRETQAVEYVTVGSAFLASVLLFIAAAKQWRISRSELGASRFPGGPVFIFVIALAAFFLTGEEINWGQTYLGWETPESVRPVSQVTSLHNAKLPISINDLGSLFILVMFVGLPIAWALRERLRLPLPRDWVPAVAEWPVVFCMAFATVWKLVKDIYRVGKSDAELKASPFYVEFVEQINEHKELLVAVGLLMYALYRLAALRRNPVGTKTGV
jgi:hypothetical protein